ncbi:hypothetical protein EMIT0347P_20196 [Pseudomonas sp. IT-347P]
MIVPTLCVGTINVGVSLLTAAPSRHLCPACNEQTARKTPPRWVIRTQRAIKTLHLEAEGYILRGTQLLDVKGVPK